MTNREKYAEEILDIVCSGNTVGVENGKVKICQEISCNDCDLCEKGVINSECRKNFAEWAKQEYVPYVDWNKVVVDTPILVRDCKNEKWFKKHFAKYENNTVFAWKNGKTSWSSHNNNVNAWGYAKLPEEEK